MEVKQRITQRIAFHINYFRLEGNFSYQSDTAVDQVFVGSRKEHIVFAGIGFTGAKYFEVQIHFLERIGDQAVCFDFNLTFQLEIRLFRVHVYHFTDHRRARYGNIDRFNLGFQYFLNFLQRNTDGVEIFYFTFGKRPFRDRLACERLQHKAFGIAFNQHCFYLTSAYVKAHNRWQLFLKQRFHLLASGISELIL